MFFLWFFSVGIVDGFRSAFRFAPRPVLPVSPFSPSFAPPFRFVCSFGRIVGRFVWDGAVFGGGAVGLSSGVARCRGVCRVRRFCQLVFVGVGGGLWFSVLPVWRLVCSARFGGAGGALPVLRVSVGADAIAMWCRLVFSSRVLVPFVSF